nr:eater [Drosophila melanogaster]ADK20130.1 eater [Drosophila melanogaster]
MWICRITIYSLLLGLVTAQICTVNVTRNIKGTAVNVQTRDCCKGYKKVRSSALRCLAQCKVNCGSGFCTKPNVCTCKKGYVNLNNDPSNRCVPYCKGCSRGTCQSPGRCICSARHLLDKTTNNCIPQCASG